jgi:hypothetical protein
MDGMRRYAGRDLIWRPVAGSWALHCAGRREAVLYVFPDDVHPGMWRVRRPDGTLIEMANLTWARDGAISIALDVLIVRTNAVG